MLCLYVRYTSFPTWHQGGWWFFTLIHTESRDGGEWRGNSGSHQAQPLSAGSVCNSMLLRTVSSWILRYLHNLWASLNGIWLCCLYFPHQVFVHVDKNILSLSFSRFNSPSCLSLSLYVSWSSSWPVAGLPPLCLCLFHNGELRIRPSTEDASYQEWI